MNTRATLNHIYRLIWSDTAKSYIPVPELTSSHTKSSHKSNTSKALQLTALLLGLIFSAPIMSEPAVNALPTGGQVTAGQASINQSGATMNIQQATQKAIINWNSFNIGKNASVNFQQPNSSAVALNRIGGTSASQIYGQLNANGQVFLVNPAGVYFGPGAQVDVGGLVASSLNIKDSDFLNSNYSFLANNTAGSITNDGKISAGNGSYIAFLSPKITNNGELNTPQGMLALASGDKVNLDFMGDKQSSKCVIHIN